jgi:hypothetical protein
VDGSAFQGPFKKVVVSTGDATAIFIGDLVYYTGSSPTTGAKILGEDVAGVPIVQRLTASSSADPANLAGVVVGVKPNPDNLMRKHRAASTDAILYICNDPQVVYEMQEDADTTPIVAASIGLNANIAFGAGVAATGVSGLEIDSNTVATTAALPLKVIGLSKKVDNDFYAGNGNVNGKFEVVLNWVLHGAGLGGTTASV